MRSSFVWQFRPWPSNPWIWPFPGSRHRRSPWMRIVELRILVRKFLRFFLRFFVWHFFVWHVFVRNLFLRYLVSWFELRSWIVRFRDPHRT